MSEYKIYEIPLNTFDGISPPAWKRTVLVDPDSSDPLLSVAACGLDEQQAYFMLAYDGVEYASYNGHMYVSAGWLMKECPDQREGMELLCKVIEQFESLEE
ncbi:MAG: hypothetical protein FWG30_08560 [Eubacteriaceae bacterium]|jgi:hypothetical protein|nr:hypothetical protein [Eubacteriaceae bacterium]